MYASDQSYLKRCFAIDQEILETLASDANTNTTDFLASDLNFDLTGVIDKDTVTSVRDVEWNTLVSLVGRCTAITIPNAYRLSYRSP
jgi:hypothetical protein